MLTLIGTTIYSQWNINILKKQYRDQKVSDIAEERRIHLRDSLEDLTRQKNESATYTRDSTERSEFYKSLDLSRSQFEYRINQDKIYFQYQQEINKRWLRELDSQSDNTSQALILQKQLIEQNLFVNAPYVQLDSVLWDSRTGYLSIYLKNFGNRPAQMAKISFAIIAPEKNEFLARPLPDGVLINPNRSEQVASAKVSTIDIIQSGTAYFVVKFSYTDFRGTKQTVVNEEAYHFDFVMLPNQNTVQYARIRPVGLEEPLKAMRADMSTRPDN